MSKKSIKLCPAVLKLVDANSVVHEFNCTHPKEFKHFNHVCFLYNENRTSMYSLKWNDDNDAFLLRKL